MTATRSAHLRKQEVFSRLPARTAAGDLFTRVEQAVQHSARKVVVLDDDPTGTQTVHGVDVLTGWQVEELEKALAGETGVFYILTNSRSLPGAEARDLNTEIGRNLCRAASLAGVEFDLISRSDSTLRGHYPDELDALEEVMRTEAGIEFDGQLLIPAFFEGGRYTIDDVHYVQEGDRLVPAAETEFARDAVFGYRHSNLARYIEEKTAGRVAAGDVLSISLADLRVGGPERVCEVLMGTAGKRRVIVNCTEYGDLECFVLGLLKAEAAGKRFLARSGASFVKIRGAIPPRAFLTRGEIEYAGQQSRGGVVVVGSYVGKTSGQVAAARQLVGLQTLELDVPGLLDDSCRAAIIAHACAMIDKAVRNGVDIMVYTSRTLVRLDSEEENLSVGQRVSAALVEIVGRLEIAPRFFIAKGGITSSDLATTALGVKSARVLGQVCPGVSVWRLGGETRFPGLPYVVFPGNVGSAETLAQLISLLNGQQSLIG
jgi:uncharacterized protein YgbK (DUF1537 family)